MILSKPLDPYDFVIQSEDRKSHLLFLFKDIELERYPSINYEVEVKDDHFTGQIETWMTYEDFRSFVEKLSTAENNEADPIRLTAMSEEEFEMTFIARSMGRYEIAYSMTKRRHSRSGLTETTLKGSFDYDIEFLGDLKERLRRIIMENDKYPEGYFEHYIVSFAGIGHKPNEAGFEQLAKLYIDLEGHEEFANLIQEIQAIKENNDWAYFEHAAKEFGVKRLDTAKLKEMAEVAIHTYNSISKS